MAGYRKLAHPRRGLVYVGHFRGIASLMIGNLKAQEFMHGAQRVRVLCSDADSRSFFARLQLVLNRLAQALHRFGSRRILRMNQHRRGKISARKHSYDMSKMRTDLVPVGRVLHIVGFYFNRPAVAIEPKVMRGFLVRKPHHFVSALHHALVVLVLGWRFLLRVHRTSRHVRSLLWWLLLRTNQRNKNRKHRGNSDGAFHFRNPFGSGSVWIFWFVTQ